MTAQALGRTNVLGVGVSALNMRLALETIDHWIREGGHHYVCITGVHGIIESQDDPELKGIHNRASLVTPDGMPLVWISRLRGQRHVSRVYGPDLMASVCAVSADRGYRHFFYGGADGVPELLGNRLQERFPGLEVVGTYSPPFRPLSKEETHEIVERINASEPDIVWVGLSTPKQERWMASVYEQISAAVLIGVGAAFDFHAGLKAQAPYWMQRSGLEWLFRLLSEPRRLWRRYLLNNPRFILLLALQLLGLQRFPLLGMGPEPSMRSEG